MQKWAIFVFSQLAIDITSLKFLKTIFAVTGVFEELLRNLDGECENLCKLSTQSMLRQKTVEQLSSFLWETFVDEEFKEKATILHKIAVTVACTRIATSRNVQKTFARETPAMRMALA